MSNLKSPFDYLDKEDLAKIEEWLSLPNPTIQDASRILGIDQEHMKALYKVEYDQRWNDDNIIPTKPPYVRRLEKLKDIFSGALVYLRSTVFSTSGADSVEIVISKASSKPLNKIYDELIKENISGRMEVDRIEVFRGRSALTAFGEPPIHEIRIRLNDKEFDAQSHQQLMEVLVSLVEAGGSALLNDEKVQAHFEKKQSL